MITRTDIMHNKTREQACTQVQQINVIVKNLSDNVV